jgi:hypothetical protein
MKGTELRATLSDGVVDILLLLWGLVELVIWCNLGVNTLFMSMGLIWHFGWLRSLVYIVSSYWPPYYITVCTQLW